MPIADLRYAFNMGIVLPFKPRGSAWLPAERTALLSLDRAFRQHGLIANYHDGVADNGSPWRVFYSVMTGQFVAHVARCGGGYAIRRADRTSLQIESIDGLAEMAASLIAWLHSVTRSG